MAPEHARARLGALLLALAVLLSPRVSAAEVPLCVEIGAPPPDLEGLRKLVKSELDRHPTHRVVDSGCRSHLHVELFEAAGARYLTAQMDREVPARYVVKDPEELGGRLTEALALVLHNDPVYLAEDITHFNDLQRFGHSLLQGGRFSYRLELFQAISNGGDGAAYASGGAFSVNRGSGKWYVLGRAYLAGALSPGLKTGAGRALQIMAGGDVGLTHELFDKAFWSPYVSGGLGLQFLRFAGRDQTTAMNLVEAQHVGAALWARVGLRFFRWSSFDVDLFAQGYFPLFRTADETSTLFSDTGIYTPTLVTGLGVGF